MKKLFIIVALALSMGASAQSFTRTGNTLTKVERQVKNNSEKTALTWKVKDKEYPIYLSQKGSAYIIRISKKTGKEYRQYLGKEVSAEVRKEVWK